MVSVSKMSGKLAGIPAINTNTATNAYCVKQYTSGGADNICTMCYSQRMLSTYRKNCQHPYHY